MTVQTYVSVEHWLAFAAASAVLLAIPGPTILLVVTHAFAARRAVRRPGLRRAVNRTGGAAMIGAGLLALSWKRAAA